MKHIKAIITLGFAVAILPFLGFPASWDTVMFVVLGLAVATLAIRIMMLAAAMERDAEPESYQQNTAPVDETVEEHHA